MVQHYNIKSTANALSNVTFTFHSMSYDVATSRLKLQDLRQRFKPVVCGCYPSSVWNGPCLCYPGLCSAEHITLHFDHCWWWYFISMLFLSAMPLTLSLVPSSCGWKRAWMCPISKDKVWNTWTNIQNMIPEEGLAMSLKPMFFQYSHVTYYGRYVHNPT